MDMSAALTNQINNLCGHDEVDNHQAAEAVTALTHDLTRAVKSYLGLQLVLLGHGHPVTLTVLHPEGKPCQIATSLRLSLAALGVPGADPGSTLTFYAHKPGAFVDLAADLGYALQRTPSGGGRAPSRHENDQPAIGLDDQAMPTTIQSGVTGAAELSTINRAIGIIISQGHHPDEAEPELTRRAVETGLSVLACATLLVRPP